MKINIGDYVRTKQGIRKIDYIDNKKSIWKYQTYIDDMVGGERSLLLTREEDIVKSSSNIIDLIEVGDYVNGWKINEINNEKKLLWHLTFYGDDDIVISENDIKTIVTHEQFEQMEYKI